MSVDSDLFLGVVVIVVAAFVGGLAARLLRVSPLIGYVAVGVVIGPHGAGVIDNLDDVVTLAEFGVVLLLFAVGIEVSLGDLKRVRSVAVVGGMIQVAATTSIGYLVGQALGWSTDQSVVFGLVLSMSSTMVVLRALSDRGELRSAHGRVLTGLLLVQDLVFVGIIAVLPALADDASSVSGELALGALKAAIALGLLGVLGGRIIPWILRRVAHLGSREVFLLTLVAITFISAALTQEFGLSAAVGAFLAGLALSQSDFGHRALGEIVPLRDTFSALFFVSLGMLADPSYVADNPETVLAVVATVVGVKLVLSALIVRAFNYLTETAVLAGFAMVQLGEFSFLIASRATDLAIVDDDFFTLVVAAAVVSVGITPLMMEVGSRLVHRMRSRRTLFRQYSLEEGASTASWRLDNHVVLAGLGRVGSLAAAALKESKVPFVVLDLDPNVISKCSDLGYDHIHGSCDNEVVLRVARIRSARMLVLATGNPLSAELAVQHALKLNPKLDIVARVNWRSEGERLQRMGVSEVVWPEMEAGLEVLRHTLTAYSASPDSVERRVSELRAELAFTGVFESVSSAGSGDPPERSEPDGSAATNVADAANGTSSEDGGDDVSPDRGATSPREPKSSGPDSP